MGGEVKQKEGIFKRALKRVKHELFKQRNPKFDWLLRSTAGGMFLFVYTLNSTVIPSLYYRITDSKYESKIEKELEQHFGIDYEGDSDETEISRLYYYLLEIESINPELLKDLDKITLLSENVCESIFVKPFNKNVGTAGFFTNTIELHHDYFYTGLADLPILAHELTHIKYNNSSKEFKKRFNSLFDWSKKKESGSVLAYKFLGKSPSWSDDTDEPRYGFMNPIGAIRNDENIAHYVESLYWGSLFLWKDVKPTDTVYQEALKLLLEEKFITQTQYNNVCDHVGFER